MRLNVALGALAATQLLASLIGQLATLRIVGIGSVTDAYIAAQALPLVLAAVVAGSLQSVWLPRLARAAGDPSLLRAEQATAQGQTLKVLICTSLPIGAASPLWVPWAFPGFSSHQFDLVVTLGGPLLAAGVMTGQSTLLTAGLRARKRFLAPEFAALAGTLAAIALILALVPRLGIVAAPWIAFGRACVVWAAHWVMAGAPSLDMRFSDRSREVWRQLLPLVGGSMFIKTGPLVDRFWSSHAAGGSVTVLNLAQLAINALATVLDRAIMVPAVPELSRRLQAGDLAGMRAAYLRSLRHAAAAVIAIGAVLLAMQPAWAWLMLHLLRLDAEPAHTVWLVSLLMIPGLYVSICGTAAVAIFYAFGETKIPVAIGIAGFLASLVLKALLFQRFGILGIAAGFSLYLMLNMAVYHAAAMKRLSRAAIS